jgi:hypothetical protein
MVHDFIRPGVSYVRVFFDCEDMFMCFMDSSFAPVVHSRLTEIHDVCSDYGPFFKDLYEGGMFDSIMSVCPGIFALDFYAWEQEYPGRSDLMFNREEILPDSIPLKMPSGELFFKPSTGAPPQPVMRVSPGEYFLFAGWSERHEADYTSIEDAERRRDGGPPDGLIVLVKSHLKRPSDW